MKRTLIILLFAIPLPQLASAQETSIPEGEPAADWVVLWNPTTDVYPRYVADPRRSRNITSIIQAFDSEVPGSGDLRFQLSVGGDYAVLRLQPRERPELAWQFHIEARLFAQFDIDNNLDELGHDGRLGAIVAKGITERTAARFVVHHTSSHLGDEYILRNDIRQRLSVRKEEIALGISHRPSRAWRTYGEIGYGLNLGERNEPLRLQTGLEYQTRPIFGFPHWYAALDVTSFEENDWELSTNVQVGIAFPFLDSGRTYRFGFEYYDGRSQLDSFFEFREKYVVVGAWLDL